jgi:cysteinyl-tRNA synthetase
LPKKKTASGSKVGTDAPGKTDEDGHSKGDALLERVREGEQAFHQGLESQDYREATKALLELDRIVWQATGSREEQSAVSRSREKIRDLIFSLGMRIDASSSNRSECLAPLIEALIQLRRDFRAERKWSEADAIRDILSQAEVTVEDTPNGSQWRFKHQEEDRLP